MATTSSTWSDGVLTATRTDSNVMANLSVTANFVLSAPASTNTVNVGPAAGLITQANPVRTVPVTISRTNPVPMLGFSVTFAVSSALNVSGGTAGIDEGPYLSTANPATVFNVIDLGVDGFGNHSYQVDGTTLGATLRVQCHERDALHHRRGEPRGRVARGPSRSRTSRCGTALNDDLASTIGTSSTVTMDRSAPTVTVVAPNGGEIWRVGAVQNITWTGGDPEGIASYDLAYSTDGGATYPNAIATVPGT